MELEYINGIRTTNLVHEMDPLESAINQYEESAKRQINKYEKLAKDHYGNDKTLMEKDRDAELKSSLAHLELERKNLETISNVQAQLAAYREKGMSATKGSNKNRLSAIAKMRAEEHHPTDTLEKYMLAEGMVKPSSKHTAHHIVPGSGKLKKVTSEARMHLHRFGIRINDPANGVYLVHINDNTPHWSMPSSHGHRKYHTHDYERWVSQRVRAQTRMDFIKTELQVIGRILQNNSPKNAIPVIGT